MRNWLLASVLICAPLTAHASLGCRTVLYAIDTNNIKAGAIMLDRVETGMAMKDAIATSVYHVIPVTADTSTDDRVQTLMQMLTLCRKDPDLDFAHMIEDVYGIHRMLQGIGHANGTPE